MKNRKKKIIRVMHFKHLTQNETENIKHTSLYTSDIDVKVN